MPSDIETYQQFITELREIAVLDSVGSILSWDRETQMPVRGTELRAQQSSLIARLHHERFTSPRIGELLAELESSELARDAESDAAVNIRWTRRMYDRETKLPARLVEEQSRTAVLAHGAWVDARKKSDFKAFQPWIEKTLDLKRQEAECVGYQGHIYNALLDPYEPDETTDNLTRVFEALRPPLVDLVGRIGAAARKAPVEILERRYPAEQQHRLARQAAELLGFDFAAGRLDISVHPFCSDIGPGDTRMTTRYDEQYFGDAFFGVLHETGHGLYDQGYPREHFGTPRGMFCSLGIHESQSRMWENLVGRSRAFWQFFYPRAQAAFGETLRGVSLEQFVFAVNDVRPSLIRTESDEVTYNLHILLRFEIEQAMLTGDLAVGDLPGAWNEKMRKYLGITPPDDARGVLQDVHWSHGSIGYFPTYTLGNLYAAQFFEAAQDQIGDLEGMFAKGEFAPLLKWLRGNIHSQGRRYAARQLVKNVTGQDLAPDPLLRHLTRKASDLYAV
jgi:carboxypeptidase Taq